MTRSEIAQLVTSGAEAFELMYSHDPSKRERKAKKCTFKFKWSPVVTGLRYSEIKARLPREQGALPQMAIRTAYERDYVENEPERAAIFGGLTRFGYIYVGEMIEYKLCEKGCLKREYSPDILKRIERMIMEGGKKDLGPEIKALLDVYSEGRRDGARLGW